MVRFIIIQLIFFSSNQAASAGTGLAPVELIAAWEFNNPGRFIKKKPRSKGREKSSKDHRIRFNSKVPFHKKAEAVDELAWALDQSDLLGVSTHHPGGMHGGNHGGNSLGGSKGGMGNNNKVQPSLVSPAPGSVGGPVTPAGAITPKGGPGSVRTPGVPDLMSPHAPAPPSNGPLTPMDMDSKNPLTPKSVPSYPVPSPFNQEKKPVIKSEILQSVLQQPPNVNSTNSSAPTNTAQSTASSSNVAIKSEPSETEGCYGMSTTQSNLGNSSTLVMNSSGCVKRPPELPMKEYEDDLESEHLRLSDTIFDTESIKLWINHPVKRFKPSDSRHNDPLKPLYRRQSQVEGLNNAHEAVEAPLEANGVKMNEAQVKTEPDSSQSTNRSVNPYGDPYEFSDGHDKRENGQKVRLPI